MNDPAMNSSVQSQVEQILRNYVSAICAELAFEPVPSSQVSGIGS